MFTPPLFKTIRMVLDRIPGQLFTKELSTAGRMNGFNDSNEDFMKSVHRIFTERGYQEVDSKSALDEQYLLFTRNDALHLVYCLPYEMFVTTIEIQTCWEAQHRLSATSSSIVAPYRFSEAAKNKAQSLAIEYLNP